MTGGAHDAITSGHRMTRFLFVIAGISFASSLFVRMTDPIVPQIAADLGVDVQLPAMLGTAFALPWALMQPILGPVADLVGKTRVITICVAILGISALIGAFAPNFSVLLVSRIVAGAAAGGVFPVSVALIGDLVPMQSRQVAIARLLIGSIGGMFVGATLSGILADLISWRGVFVATAASAMVGFIAAALGLRGTERLESGGLNLKTALANYRQVFSNPRAKVCYAAVFAEGVALFGLFPYVALLLQATGEVRASIAGLVVAGFAIGGLIYSLSVGRLVARFGQRQLMVAGGSMAALALLTEAALPPWPVQLVAISAMGLGFFLLHGSIQVQMTELAPTARGTAVAMHSFSYFMGQALGPIAYLAGFALIGQSPTLIMAAAIMAMVGFVVPRLLFGSPAPPQAKA
jgi:MFS transporter, DHA1 family, inner membrane transport protein